MVVAHTFNFSTGKTGAGRSLSLRLGLPSEFSARQSYIVRPHLKKGGKPKVYIIQSQLFFFRSQNDFTGFCIKMYRSTKEKEKNEDYWTPFSFSLTEAASYGLIFAQYGRLRTPRCPVNCTVSALRPVFRALKWNLEPCFYFPILSLSQL